MKTLRSLLFISTIISFFFISCSSSDDDEMTQQGPDFAISELQGTWEATSAIFSPSDPNSQSSSVDIIAEGGTLTMVVQSNGRFSLTFNLPEVDSFEVTGEMFFENNEFFAIRFDDEPDDYEYLDATLTATTFVLNSGPDVAEWDFNGDETDEPASITFEFVKT